MNIIEHGAWVQYQGPGEDHPPGTLFAKRESDNWDWYDYTRHPSSPFVSASTVKFTAMTRPGGFIVGAAVYDPTMLFPPGQSVYEITDYAGNNPQADFGNKVYDPATKTFSDPVLPPVNDPLVEIRRRLEALEKKKGP